MDRFIKATLKNIDISYLFADRIEHGIEFHCVKHFPYEPSKFIYSFFSFNMLYEKDWSYTLMRKRGWGVSREKFASDKIYWFLEFIYSHQSALLFNDYYKKRDVNLSIIPDSRYIVPDDNIRRPDPKYFSMQQNSYLENFMSALKNLNSTKFSIEDHYRLLIFCYQIRNNIFHGLKKASEMIHSGQPKRLLNYSNIILATIEMFFDIIRKEHSYVPATEDELAENIQIRS